MILINKPRGLTPLEAIERFVEQNPIYKQSKLAYAGRLDPQAEGLLLVLENEECLKRDAYQQLDKTYEFDLLLGFSTDTGDIMGLIQSDLTNDKLSKIKPEIKLTNANLVDFIGKQAQNYPAFSSKTVKGKKLFQWALEAKFPQISHEINIYELRILEEFNISSATLLEFIHKNINYVTGNFRQTEILALWDKALGKETTNNFTVYKLEAKVSSGTYIRKLCQDIGNKLDLPALALSIKRTKVDKFDLADSITLK